MILSKGPVQDSICLDIMDMFISGKFLGIKPIMGSAAMCTANDCCSSVMPSQKLFWVGQTKLSFSRKAGGI